MERRDEYANWQEPVGRGDRWSYGSERYEPEDDGRVPAPRSGEPRYGSYSEPAERRPPVSPPPSGGVRGPRSGEPLPPLGNDPLFGPLPPPGPAPQEGALQQPTGAVDAAAVRRSISQTDGLYRSRKPIFLAIYGILATIGDLLMLRPFFDGLPGIAALAPLLAMLAFPLLAIGMYGLATGAATAVQFQGPRVWLRTPLVYLPIGLCVLVAAGAAVA